MPLFRTSQARTLVGRPGAVKADVSVAHADPASSLQTGRALRGGPEAPASSRVLERALNPGSCRQRRKPGDLHRPGKFPLERSVQRGDSLACPMRVKELDRLPFLDHHDRVIRCVVDGVEDAARFFVHRRDCGSEDILDGGELAGIGKEDGDNNDGFSHGDHR
jgi:hypothetical protein